MGRERRPLWLMLPGGILLLLVVGVPFALAAWMGFSGLDQYSLREWLQAPWVGLANFVEALGSAGMPHALWLSVSFSLLTTVFAAPIGIVAALTVNGRMRGRALVRSIYLVPYVIPQFVTAMLWRVMLQPDGAVNRALESLGLPAGQWLIGPNTFWTLVFVDVWASWAFIYMLTLAGLQTIPAEQYEAADMDGVTWWQKIRYVVLPQLRGPLSLALLLSTLHHFNNFTLPFVLFGTPAPEAVSVLPIAIYQISFQVFRFGLGAAMSILSLVVVAVPAVLYLRSVGLIGRRDHEA
ncbi:sugar ABC transporter permease [Allokutzneria sp. A3M-2-11 16]|uniref:carbohydrate ABC transporter permease n=1 Tax=Allokutzneria sp. A3M-2-11 16 TaxID=2962043 RepID=UPI0020B8B4BB|nr:sugar ABC transporter permease [Allokutzneria sp. A3M-2-11 16]MCP3803095.1 sugar ABC transporter permease [Allokutzneria sp. A3M-2-11 16]